MLYACFDGDKNLQAIQEYFDKKRNIGFLQFVNGITYLLHQLYESTANYCTSARGV